MLIAILPFADTESLKLRQSVLFPWVTVPLLPIITKPMPFLLNLPGKQTLEGALPSQAAVTTEGLPLQSPKPGFKGSYFT